jgi:hypothetical protein
MKKASILLLLIFLSNNISYCQLLNDSSLSVDDFETALINPDNLRRVLIQNNFDYTSGIVGNLNGSTIINPLVPDLEATKSEFYIEKSTQKTSSDFVSGFISQIRIYDWKPGHSPKPDVIRTIIIFLNEDFINTEEVIRFLEQIKNKYTKVESSKDREFYQGDHYDIFSNDYNSKIQVRSGTTWIDWMGFSNSYNISFDLLK